MPLTKRRIAAVTAATAVIATMGLASPAYAVPVADTPEKIVKAVKISQVIT